MMLVLQTSLSVSFHETAKLLIYCDAQSGEENKPGTRFAYFMTCRLDPKWCNQWMKANFGVRVLIIVVPHSFGRH